MLRLCDTQNGSSYKRIQNEMYICNVCVSFKCGNKKKTKTETVEKTFWTIISLSYKWISNKTSKTTSFLVMFFLIFLLFFVVSRASFNSIRCIISATKTKTFLVYFCSFFAIYYNCFSLILISLQFTSKQIMKPYL